MRKVFLSFCCLLPPFLFLLLLAPPDAGAFGPSSKSRKVTVSVLDKNNKEIASAHGVLVKNRTVRTTCRIVAKWLDEVEYNLVVKTGESAYSAVERVLSSDCRKDSVLLRFEEGEYIPKQPSPPPPPVPLPAPKEERMPPAPTAESYFQTGTSRFNANRNHEAMEAFREAVRLKPDLWEAHVSLGTAYYRLGRYTEAADSYRKALSIKPDHLPAYSKLGTVCIMLGDYTEAVGAFKKALQLDEKNPSTHFNLGIASFLAGDTNAALQEYIILKGLDKVYANSLLDLIYP